MSSKTQSITIKELAIRLREKGYSIKKILHIIDGDEYYISNIIYKHDFKCMLNKIGSSVISGKLDSYWDLDYHEMSMISKRIHIFL